jgi:hypothetical protein
MNHTLAIPSTFGDDLPDPVDVTRTGEYEYEVRGHRKSAVHVLPIEALWRVQECHIWGCAHSNLHEVAVDVVYLLRGPVDQGVMHRIAGILSQGHDIPDLG